MEARNHSGTPVFRNETLLPNPGEEAQGEREKYLSSPPKPFPGPYLVTFQEWRPQLALGLPEVRTCFQAKPPPPMGINLAMLFMDSSPFLCILVCGYAPRSSSSSSSSLSPSFFFFLLLLSSSPSLSSSSSSSFLLLLSPPPPSPFSFSFLLLFLLLFFFSSCQYFLLSTQMYYFPLGVGARGEGDASLIASDM